jgi:hypothetical protein
MCLLYAQLVPLPKLSHTIRFSSDHNTRWRLLNLSNYNFMIYLITSKTPSIQEENSSFDAFHATTHLIQAFIVSFSYYFILKKTFNSNTYLLTYPSQSTFLAFSSILFIHFIVKPNMLFLAYNLFISFKHSSCHLITNSFIHLSI